MSAPSPWPTEHATHRHPSTPHLSGADTASDLDLVKVLFGHKLLTIFLTLVGLGGGYYLFSKAKPVYTASARIRVFQTRPMASAIDGKSVINAPPPLDTYAVLITSPSHLQSAAAEFQDQNSDNALMGATPEHAQGYVASGLSVRPSSGSKEFLDFSFSGPYPADCPKVLNAVVDAFLKYLENSQRGDTEKAVELISNARSYLDQDLKEKQKSYNEFKAQAELVFVGEKSRNLHQERMSQIEGARATYLIQESQIRSELEAIESALKRGASRETVLLMVDNANRLRNDPTSSSSSASPSVSLSSQLLPLVFEEEKLLSSLGSEHPRVREVRRKIELTRAMFEQREPDTNAADKSQPRADWLTVYIDSLRQGLKKIEQQTADLDALFEKERAAARELSREENQDQTFRDEIDRTSRLFDTVLDQLQALNLVKDNGTLKAEVISRPGHGWQVGPAYGKYLGGGAMVGWLIAVGLSFLIESSNRGFHGVDDVSRRLGLPVLGTIPLIDQKPSRRELRSKTLDRMAICFHKPASFAAEAYRSVRSAIMLGNFGQGIRVLQITSSEAGAGKSTMSANLAISVAQSGKRCLLIDADCRRPAQHKLFGMHNDVGLSSVIQEQAEIPDAVRTTDVERLEVMTSGPRPFNPSELLMSESFRNLLDRLRETYDFVVIDSPPVLAVTDACIISPHTDGVVFLTRLGRNSRVFCTRGLERLRMVGARVLGVTLNAVSQQTSEYGLGRYHSGYRYGYVNEEYFREQPPVPEPKPADSQS